MDMERVIIMGAAGRDFHNFNVYFRTIAATRSSPSPQPRSRTSTAGSILPNWRANSIPQAFPIHPEKDLADLIRKHRVDLVAFSYSDMPHVEVMHKASLAMAKGADFILIGATYTMLRSSKPVVAVCARSGPVRQVPDDAAGGPDLPGHG